MLVEHRCDEDQLIVLSFGEFIVNYKEIDAR